MDSTSKPYASFPFEWIVKSTTYKINYRKGFDIDEIDEVFCTIIKANENQIELSVLGTILGFNIEDFAEKDILNTYLDGLIEYNLIKIDKNNIQLTEFGAEALISRLKYKYNTATTELFENQTVTGDTFAFSFKNIFDIENKIAHENIKDYSTFESPKLKKSLLFQSFENNIYNGEIVELIESNPKISYQAFSLNCDITTFENSFQISISKFGIDKPEIVRLIELSENSEYKEKLIRIGMYHHILANNDTITVRDIDTYIDLWNWKELAENEKVDWSDKSVFELFRTNGDGSIWSVISEKAPIEHIKSVIDDYEEYWNWFKLTKRFDNDFIREHIEKYNWDFEELSSKDGDFVTTLLSNKTLINQDWDWNYLSKNLPDEFIEKYIDDFPWDFYELTTFKNEIFKNVFNKNQKNLENIISKPWNWIFISEEINLNFLYKNISCLATKVDWHTVLNRFFNDTEITGKCLKVETFIVLLKKSLPENFVVSHQNYIWSKELIDFFDQQNLIQWATTYYINGFDTNEYLEWNKDIFQQYYIRITSEQGKSNVSEHISDYSLIEDFPDFDWSWESISKNKNLINNTSFVESALQGEFSFSNNLLWNEIFLQSTFDISFWNIYLEEFYNLSDNEKHTEFWRLLTIKEEQKYILENYQFPWDWKYITENSSADTILESFYHEDLIEKWNWEIVTRKLDKETILDNIEEIIHFVDWKYLVSEVFTIEEELSMDNLLPKIAAYLSVIETNKRKEIWHILTAKYPFDILFNYIKVTYQLDIFEWDWNYISIHKLFPTDINTLNRYKQKIDWSIFSESKGIQQKFNPETWNSGKEWFENIDQYLLKFENFWDWQVLSRNRNINYNRILLIKYRTNNWDWEYLTEFGGFLTKQKRDNDKYLGQLVKQFPKIRFEFLSRRKDISIDTELILSNRDKNWDWKELSENDRIKISKEILIELKHKDWNWYAISQRKNIDFDNEIFIKLLDKDWDWGYLSNNSKLEFNIEFIEKTKSKQWEWKTVSKHKSFLPTLEILSLTADFDLDWKHLSKDKNLIPTKELLAKFENKWDWQKITENPQINFSDIDFIERFADKWDWKLICESGKLKLSNEILNRFKLNLEWDLISANTNIDFTKKIIQKYKSHWNWSVLKENKRIEELFGNYVTEEISKSSVLSFVDKIDQQWSVWKGNIYHFTHIENAVEIIKNRKIQSRNKANIKGDAAGNVVHSRSDAHDYARFYFRPHTPTQFYNEFLGKNTSDGYQSNINGWVSWYDKARGLGHPKCPVPIFFRFSLKEVLFKNENNCCISNGNMQTSSTRFGSIERMIDKFGFEDLFYTPEQYATKEDYNKYRNYAQQEFLVKEELSFDDFADFEIICPSEADRNLLINLLGNENKHILQKIVVQRDYYNNENPRIRVEEDENELHISTTFNGNGYFLLDNIKDARELEILSGDVSKIEKNKIIFKTNVSLENAKQSIQLNFIDESNRKWFVYRNEKSNNLKKNFFLDDEIDNMLYESLNTSIRDNIDKLLSQKVSHAFWNKLSYPWKIDLILNIYLNNNSSSIKIYSAASEMHLFEIFSDYYASESIPLFHSIKEILINLNKIKYFIYNGSNLYPVNELLSLEHLYISNTKAPSLNIIKNENIKFIDCHYSSTITSEDISSFQKRFPSVKINNFNYAFFYTNLNTVNKNSPFDIDSFINLFVWPNHPFLSTYTTDYKSLFDIEVHHYYLKDHIKNVLGVFELYFTKNSLPFSLLFFRCFLTLHDIGKPKAFLDGNMKNQHIYTKRIIKSIWDELPFNINELHIVLALLDGDYIGEYFQIKISVAHAKNNICQLANTCGLDTKLFFKSYMIYYQCDIASYTADAGGIKYLEHLFDYENGKKIFDAEEGLLKMSPKYWEMYKKLKREIENGD